MLKKKPQYFCLNWSAGLKKKKRTQPSPVFFVLFPPVNAEPRALGGETHHPAASQPAAQEGAVLHLQQRRQRRQRAGQRRACPHQTGGRAALQHHEEEVRGRPERPRSLAAVGCVKYKTDRPALARVAARIHFEAEGLEIALFFLRFFFFFF